MPHWCKMVFRQKLDGGAEASTSDLLLVANRWRTLETPQWVVGGTAQPRLDRLVSAGFCCWLCVGVSVGTELVAQLEGPHSNCHYCFESPVVRRHIAEGYWQCFCFVLDTALSNLVSWGLGWVAGVGGETVVGSWAWREQPDQWWIECSNGKDLSFIVQVHFISSLVSPQRDNNTMMCFLRSEAMNSLSCSIRKWFRSLLKCLEFEQLMVICNKIIFKYRSFQ